MTQVDACFSIDREKGHVSVYDINRRYPLDMWEELRWQTAMTHQELANVMVRLGNQEESDAV
jgi:hypothetical protein